MTVPPAALLSDGLGHLTLVTASGTGFSSLHGDFLNAWRADALDDPAGFLIYLRDPATGHFQRIGTGPGGKLLPDPGGIEIMESFQGLEVRLMITVDPGTGIELRAVLVFNPTETARTVEVTSYLEVVLQDPRAFAAHPSFSRLFVQTEFDRETNALLARRRPRSPEESHPWLVHAAFPGGAEFETDRARFVGRSGSTRAPRALTGKAPLSGTTGNVLDPVVSLRRSVTVETGHVALVTFVLGTAADRETARRLPAPFGEMGAVERTFNTAGSVALERLRQLDVSESEAIRFDSIAAALLQGRPGLRARPEVLARASGRIGSLAGRGIPTGGAVAVLHAEHPAGRALLPEVLKANRYWRALGLPISLVVVGGETTATAGEAGVTRIEPDALSPAERDLLDAMARLVITDRLPELSRPEVAAAEPSPTRSQVSTKPAGGSALAPANALTFYNGCGGFDVETREYVIQLRRGEGDSLAGPPRPWVNVIANDDFGFLVSETGAGNTWHRNSREHRLTPWSNDTVVDPHGEAFYVRDEATGATWSLLPGPAPGDGDYEMRHGFGYSRCRAVTGSVEHDTRLFVPESDPLRVALVRLTNHGELPRRLSLVSFYRMVLGDLPEESGRYVVTEAWNAATITARNRMSEFPDAVAFSSIVGGFEPGSARVTGDRAAFLGAGGDMARPAALRGGATLDGRTGAGLDPCLAQQVTITVPPGGTVDLGFLFGEADTEGAARDLLARHDSIASLERAFDQVRSGWTERFGRLQVKTPSPALDLMINGWLPYQTIACRIRARTAFYQSGGAFGFRDQLQDATSLTLLEPGLARAQILLHAAHQFVEGDVLHWWHPPASRGIRTRFADDLLWLPLLTAYYIRTTGDRPVLDERVRYITARLLEPGEDETFLEPADSGTSGDVHEHCLRALDRSLAVGAHGLPLFGTGDWNDGMNRVGREGRGESVWMGFFLHQVLGDYMEACGDRIDAPRRARYTEHRAALSKALNDGGWDGEWYRRGYYDDGTPLGSKESDECRIDALAQSWSVLSGVAPPERARAVMDQVETQLISPGDMIVRLLTPPFENSTHDPGYIKGYVAGVRENGGQYTHAAMWVVQAMAALGRNDRVAALLEMMNPIAHTSTPEDVARYQAEPYVVAADVYGAEPHIGRGGWTWYTGSSGWMYRVAIESLLGLRLVGGDRLEIRPCIPAEWPGFEISYQLAGRGESYRIVVENRGERSAGGASGPPRVVEATIDDRALELREDAAVIPLVKDTGEHVVRVMMESA